MVACEGGDGICIMVGDSGKATGDNMGVGKDMVAVNGCLSKKYDVKRKREMRKRVSLSGSEENLLERNVRGLIVKLHFALRAISER